MDQRKVFAGALVFMLVLGLSPLIMEYFDQDNSIQDTRIDELESSEVRTTDDGTKYTVHPDELQQGCPGKDCIPSIDDPQYENGDEADWMDSDDEVIGVEIDGDAKAYPLRILDRHEIVNTEVGGDPVSVTYCPLCRSGVTYSRELDGETLEFGVSGKLRDANLVMYDRSSETYWSQIGGNAIIGPRVPQKLDLVYSSITTWEDWKSGHPDTEVLSRNTGIYPASSYSSRSYLDRGYGDSERVGFGVGEVDDRLPSKELVHGFKVGNSSKAYPEDSLEKGNLIEDEIGGQKVAILKRPDDGTVIGLETELEGKDLELEVEDQNLVDSQGRKWSFAGEEIDGERELKVLVPQEFYWFAWAKFNPDTEVYQE